MVDSGSGTNVPKLSHLVRDDLLQAVLGHFTRRTGVRVWFQDVTGYTIAPDHEVPAYCSILLNHDRCGLANPAVDMPPDAGIPQFRTCIGGIGHLIFPVRATASSGVVTELGRMITEPLSIRETNFDETLAEAEVMHIHPDTLASSAGAIIRVDAGELKELADILELAVGRVASETSSRARTVALAEAFEELGLRGNREVMDELLSKLVKEFTDADAAILTTAGDGSDQLTHVGTFSPDVAGEQREMLVEFTAEVTRWINQTGYPISFPDLGGSSWCKHVLGGRELEGSLVAVPIKLPAGGRGWWTAYYRRPTAQMEDQLHRLSVLAAHTAQTLSFHSRLAATQQEALTDPLTGLHNRRYLIEQLERELARSSRSKYPVSLIIFDIDNFKDVNDEHGHVAGDEALLHVATVLSRPLRRSSTICRYGGDEFCVVVPECDEEEAQLVAQRLKGEIEGQPLELHDGTLIRLSVSGGVATLGPDSAPELDLFEMADNELIRAKRQGKGRIRVR